MQLNLMDCCLFYSAVRPSVRLVVYLFVHLNWKICFIVISLNHSEHSNLVYETGSFVWDLDYQLWQILYGKTDCVCQIAERRRLSGGALKSLPCMWGWLLWLGVFREQTSHKTYWSSCGPFHHGASDLSNQVNNYLCFLLSPEVITISNFLDSQKKHITAIT